MFGDIWFVIIAMFDLGYNLFSCSFNDVENPCESRIISLISNLNRLVESMTLFGN